MLIGDRGATFETIHSFFGQTVLMQLNQIGQFLRVKRCIYYLRGEFIFDSAMICKLKKYIDI